MTRTEKKGIGMLKIDAEHYNGQLIANGTVAVDPNYMQLLEGTLASFGCHFDKRTYIPEQAKLRVGYNVGCHVHTRESYEGLSKTRIVPSLDLILLMHMIGPN